MADDSGWIGEFKAEGIGQQVDTEMGRNGEAERKTRWRKTQQDLEDVGGLR